MNKPTLAILRGLPALGAALLAGCSVHASIGHTTTGSTAPAHSAAPAAPAAQKALTYDLVRPIGDQEMGRDPGCGYGEWGTNSTGIDNPYRAQATAIHQFDCWAKKGELFPNAGQQAIFITFGTPDEAAGYVKAQAPQAWQAVGYLQSGTGVLEVHQGRLTLDRVHFLKDAQTACACGTITTTALATGPTPGFTGTS